KPVTYQGEDAVGNGIVIPFQKGGSIKYSGKIAYSPSMDASKLELRLHGRMGSKEMDFNALNLADGVITTSLLVKSDDKPIWSKDNFVRVLSFTNDSTIINFDVSSSVLKPAELNQQDVKNLGVFLNNIGKNPRAKLTQIEFLAYASPEGEQLRNTDLSSDRAKSGRKAFMDLVKKANITNAPESVFKESGLGEDWEGFRSAMEQSNIGDRNIIISVLQMTKDLDQREKEIRNITATYKEIEKSILPGLRRCKIIAKYDIEGYSDDELRQISSSNPSSLKYEELLKAGTLVDDINKKIAIYTAAAAKSDADYRAFNNLGCAYFSANKLNEAESNWTKAYGMKKCAETSNNMGVMNRVKGNRADAAKYLNEAGSSSETSYNKGILSIQKGDYANAVSQFGNAKTFNSSLAKLLHKDNGGAKTDMDGSNDQTAMADYLRAIICARSGDAAGVGSNLSKAFGKDGSLREKANKDLEFAKYKDQIK
ncbi:MAG: tetratricopeptide repeat protein, partial [Flavobacteriales bacterium]